MIVRKRAVLVAELIPQRDSGLDDLGLSGSALPFLAEVFCEQRFDNTRQVLRDLADVGEEILIERQIDGALAGIDVVAKFHVLAYAHAMRMVKRADHHCWPTAIFQSGLTIAEHAGIAPAATALRD
jgi:uncharacterized protein YuzE